MRVLRLPLQPLWQQLAGWPIWQPTRLAIAGSVVLHGIILALVRVPDTTPAPIDINETVELMSIPAELEADLPSIEPLLPTELPAIESVPPPLPFTGIEPPPLTFSPLPPLPPLPPLADLPPPPPLTFQPLPSPWQLPPPARPRPDTGTPEQDVATAPELAPPSPAPPPQEPLATTDGEAAAALSRWFNQTRLTLNTTNIGINLSQRVTDLYPPDACGDRLQGQATVAAVITPDGQLLPANAAPETGLLTQNPQIIRTSGSTLLDQAAIAAVKQQTFSATGQYQALAITFDFQYRPEVCTATRPTPTPQAPPPAREATPIPQSSPTPPVSTPQSSPTPEPPPPAPSTSEAPASPEASSEADSVVSE